MDDIDAKILEILQMDGRITISELSTRLMLSRASLTERIHRMQEHGILTGFTARVSPAKVGRPVLVWMQVSDLRVTCHKFEDTVQKMPDIVECHRVTGAASYVMKAAVASMERLEALVDALIEYGRINTSVVLSTPVAHRVILPPATP
ncbi:Lrp/AsnC family transcriptional regulator [Alicyclobacillus contaminans]|uniref:Lrp/AsnC family transcriptional regulator n=1 Tax=Alicyclobacillus contaminans TaxID=392016 RepID=UPI00041EDE95|nr:Lrp/AsnC family transcriptional regulator [Alicyclobacillus contaminans]